MIVNFFLNDSLLASGRKPTTYVPMLPLPILQSGNLSAAQYESVARAGQAMEKVVSNAKGQLVYRKGFIIGDGTGIGKGRQIAAIISDNWFQGRTRSVWVSCSRSLVLDAQRDFDDIGIVVPLFELGGKGLKGGSLEKQIRTLSKSRGLVSDRDSGGGVVFATYSSLFRPVGKKGNRLKYHDLVDWLNDCPSGEQGVIAFDEVGTFILNFMYLFILFPFIADLTHFIFILFSNGGSHISHPPFFISLFSHGYTYTSFISVKQVHKAKNLVPPKHTGGSREISKFCSKTGLAVHDLQVLLPQCRVLYCSATGMSRPNAVAPFLRIGWWSDGSKSEVSTPFPTFQEFANQISGAKGSASTSDMSSAAMGRMEMAARELAKETMLSRTLALEDAAFAVIAVNVDAAHQLMYDRACVFFSKLINFFSATFATMKKYDSDRVDHTRTKKAMRVLNMQMWGAHQKL